MKKLLFFTCCIALATVSCERSDNIIYNGSPNIEMQTVRFYDSTNSGSPYFCTNILSTPIDSTASIQLDLDDDQKPDFKITARHIDQDNTCGGVCYKATGYNIKITSLDDDKKVAGLGDDKKIAGEYQTRIFNSSEMIDGHALWASELQMELVSGHCTYRLFLPDHGYLGVRMKKSFGYIEFEKLGNNGIRILSHAMNKTPKNGIKCGQQ